MPQYTPNYNLYKPSRNDTGLATDTTLANNFTIIDSEIKNRKNEINALTQQIANMPIGGGGSGNGNNTVTWANVLSKPTTINGFGITDAYTITQVNSAITTAISNALNPINTSIGSLNSSIVSINTNITANTTNINTLNTNIGTVSQLQTTATNLVAAINEVRANIGTGGGGGSTPGNSTTYQIELSRWGITQGFPTKPYTNAKYNIAKANIDGINNALAWAKSNGYNNVIFPNGNYSICYPTSITPQANTTIDFNNSTFKVMYDSDNRSPFDTSTNPTCTFGGTSILVTTPNTHIRNLTLIGDRIERSWSNLAVEQNQENTIGIVLGTGSDFSSVKYCDISYYMEDAIYLSYSPYTHMDVPVMEVGDISNTGTLVTGATNVIRTASYITLTSGISSFGMIGLGYNPETTIPSKSYNVYFYNSSNTFISSKKYVRTRDRVTIPKGATKIKLTWTGNGTLDDGTNPPNNPPYWVTLIDKGIAENTLIEYNILHRNHRGAIFLGHNNATIRKNYIHDTGVDGALDIDGIPTFPDGTRYGINTEDNIGQNCTIENNAFDNIRIAIALRGEYNNVTQNEFRNCLYSIILYYQKHITVDKNYFYASQFACFEFNGFDRDWIITNNVFAEGSNMSITGIGGSVTNISNNTFKNSYFTSTPRVFKFVHNLFDGGTITLNDNFTRIEGCVFINGASIKATGLSLVDCITGCTFTNGSYVRGQNGGTVVIKNSFLTDSYIEYSTGTMTFKYIGCEITNTFISLIDSPASWLDIGVVAHNLELINSKVSIGASLIHSVGWGGLTIDGSTITLTNTSALPNVLHSGSNDFTGTVYINNSTISSTSSTATHSLSTAKEFISYNNSFPNVTITASTIVPATINKSNILPTSGNYVLGQIVTNSNPVIGGSIGWVCTTAGTFSNGSWVASTSYTVGKLVDVNGKVYKCTVAGTSGSVSPNHSSGTGVDGSVTWLYISPKPVLTPYGSISGVLDTTPPNEVTGLSTSNVTTTSVTLRWTASTSTDIASYDIYNGSTLIANTTSVNYIVNGLSLATNYTFYVKGKDTSNNVSTGVSVSVTTASAADTTPPNNVTNLVVTNLASKTLTLSWTGSTSSDIESYDIYNGASLLGNTTSTVYNVTGLTASTSYTFYVKAKDISGNVASGTTVSTTTAAPSATLVLRDSFNRTDTTSLGACDTGQTWSSGGTQGVSGNQGYVSADYGGVGISPGALTDYSVESVFSAITSEPTLLFKRVDGNTAVGVAALSGSYEIKGFNIDEGWTTYQSKTGTPINGDVVKVTVVSGVANVYLNGSSTPIMTWTISSKYSVGTQVGLRSTSSTNRFDEFKVYSL